MRRPRKALSPRRERLLRFAPPRDGRVSWRQTLEFRACDRKPALPARASLLRGDSGPDWCALVRSRFPNGLHCALLGVRCGSGRDLQRKYDNSASLHWSARCSRPMPKDPASMYFSGGARAAVAPRPSGWIVVAWTARHTSHSSRTRNEIRALLCRWIRAPLHDWSGAPPFLRTGVGARSLSAHRRCRGDTPRSDAGVRGRRRS
jgi:hypothetical protein